MSKLRICETPSGPMCGSCVEERYGAAPPTLDHPDVWTREWGWEGGYCCVCVHVMPTDGAPGGRARMDVPGANRTYIGELAEPGNWDTAKVTVDGQPLPLRLEVVRKSPTGFAWGYEGSGPAQLSFAILAEHFVSDRPAADWVVEELARQRKAQAERGDAPEVEEDPSERRRAHDLGFILMQDFKRRVIARLPQERGWQLTSEEVQTAVSAILAERRTSRSASGTDDAKGGTP